MSVTQNEETVEIELRLPPDLAMEIHKLAAAGTYGDTPEAVIEYILSNVELEQETGVQDILDSIADRGQKLVDLGNAMTDPKTTITELARLAFEARIPLQFLVRDKKLEI